MSVLFNPTPQIADTSSGGATSPNVIAAHSSTLTPPIGKGWLAAGDAGLSFDPLASQEIFHALYTGLAAAQAVERALSGDNLSLREYADAISRIETVDRRNIDAWYQLERRWPSEEFWKRRLK